MSMRSVVWLPAFVLGLALLILIVGFGAIVAIRFRNRRLGFSYFAGRMTTGISDEGDIAQTYVP